MNVVFDYNVLCMNEYRALVPGQIAWQQYTDAIGYAPQNLARATR